MSSAAGSCGHAGSALADFGQQLAQAFGQKRNLHLLEDHRHQPVSVASLQVEGSAARLADRAGHEPIRAIEVVDASSHLASSRVEAQRASPWRIYTPSPKRSGAAAVGAQAGLAGSGGAGSARGSNLRHTPNPVRLHPLASRTGDLLEGDHKLIG